MIESKKCYFNFLKIEPMKNIQLTLLSFLFTVFIFTSCTNNEDIVEPQNTDESTSITTALAELGYRFNNDGSLNSEANPANNIIFDFCFDFVYPLNLSYNTGATVTVNNLDDIIEVIINSTDDLYINGIAFPFDVETYNDTSGSIVVQTINNEDDFIALLESCDFDNVPSCLCTEEYMPVCIEIETGSNESFIITYPNACYAECDGFTSEDFLEECVDDTYNGPDDDECFTFIFPLSIITDDGETITVNSEEELDISLYNAYYFDFVYPFSIMMNDATGVIITINNEQEFYEVLDNCYDYWNDDCNCTDEIDEVCVEIITATGQIITYTFPNACWAECEGFSAEDFVECGNTGSCNCTDEINPVCVEMEDPSGSGETILITFPNSCWAECEGFSAEDFVECENTGSCNCTDEENPVCVEFTDPATGNVVVITFLNECYAMCEGFTPNNFIDCN